MGARRRSNVAGSLVERGAHDPRFFLLAQPDAHEQAHQAPHLATRRGLTFVYLFISPLSALDNRRPFGITSRSQVRPHRAWAANTASRRVTMRHKLRLELQWLGTNYCGWQAQPGVPGPPSIFEVVHAALKEATGQDGGPVAAGRTDKGVHAMRQAATVTVRGPPRADAGGGGDGEGDGDSAASAAAAERRAELEALVARLNTLLPPDVRMLSVADAPPSAHALTDAVRKTYSYFLLAGPSAAERCVLWSVGRSAWVRATMDRNPRPSEPSPRSAQVRGVGRRLLVAAERRRPPRRGAGGGGVHGPPRLPQLHEHAGPVPRP